MDHLKKLNPHERDDHIVFDEEPHIYYVYGDPTNTSVTTLVHKYFPKFNPDLVISRMMRSKNWPNSKYYGMTADEIKEQWSQNGLDATTKGTYLHKSIEAFYNNQPVSDNDTPEYTMFLQFYNDHKELLEPYRTEWEVYDEDLHIAGSIDMVFRNKDDDTLSIYDWKRSKEIKMSNPYGGRGFTPLNKFHDCNYIHYSLQLNIYKRILETKYGKTIRDMYLVCLHPNYDKYMKYQVMDMQTYVGDILNAHHLKSTNQLEDESHEDVH